LLESLDTSFRSERRIEHTLELPVRGTVELGSRRQLAKTNLDARLQEPYQMLRTNLVYSDSRTDTPIYIFSSPTKTERRARVLGNLALAAADSGQRVLLLDADLRNTDLTDILQLSNEHGLTDYLMASPDSLEDPQRYSELRQQITLREVSEHLDVIPSGTTTENPIRLLESKLMKDLLERLRHDDYDFIIVNTPPILLFPDASTLASLTEIEVLLILEHARSRSENAVAALDQVQQIGGHLNGVIYVR
jgi:capsular exopolysaccharide synthesis family protein